MDLTSMGVGLILLGVVASAGILFLVMSFIFRTVVPTNKVHIVQSAGERKSYGKGSDHGNVYYRWPSWFPRIGVTHIVMPVSNVALPLKGYVAYDVDRVPFQVDIVSFFRIDDTNLAAERVSNYNELMDQLKAIVQGAVRKILAGSDINEIMGERAKFGEQFTEEVRSELASWGVVPVKNMELMDISDAEGSQAIADIQAKKQSEINKDSRTVIAQNDKEAQLAEITAKQETDLRQVEADKQVGEKQAEQDKAVGIANEMAQQEIKEQQAVTAEKDMSVKKVEALRQAEIDRDTAKVNLAQAKLDAEATLAEGQAEADVRKKIFEADNALEMRLKYGKETAVEVAQAFAEGNVSLVPNIVMGSTGEGGNADASSTLINMMTALVAQNSNLVNVDAPDEKTTQSNAQEEYGKRYP